MGASVEQPPPRDYAQETRDTLKAQIDLAPDRYAAEAQFQPLYTQLGLQNLRSALQGTAENPGLISTYEDLIYPAMSRASNAERMDRIGGELDAVRKYAGDVAGTLREASGNAPLLDELNRQALDELKAGSGMDPELANTVSQGVRAAQAARGFGFGSPDAVTEAFARGERGLALKDSRRRFAGNVLQANQLTGGDPFMAILGRPSQTLQLGQNMGMQGQSFNPGNQFNPESGYAQDVYDSNFNAANAAAIADANNSTALTSSMISTAGSMASSA